MRSVSVSLILLIAVAGLVAGGVDFLRAAPDQPLTAAYSPGPDCDDDCPGGDAVACSVACGATVSFDLGLAPAMLSLVADPPARQLAVALELYRSTALAPDPPRPKLHFV